MSTVILTSSGPNILVRLIYFAFVGWWFGLIVSALAWLLNCTVVGLPLGLMLINRLPSIITLRPQETSWRLDASGALRQGQMQHPFLVRAAYFLVIGWWLSGLWLSVAYALLVTLLGIPVAFWMYGRVGAITTLYRS